MRKFYIRLPIGGKPFCLSEVGSSKLYYSTAKFKLHIKGGILCGLLIILALIYCFAPATRTVYKAHCVGIIIGGSIRYWKYLSIKAYLTNYAKFVKVPDDIRPYEDFKFDMYILFNSFICLAGIIFSIYTIGSFGNSELNLVVYLTYVAYTTVLILLDSRSKRFPMVVNGDC